MFTICLYTAFYFININQSFYGYFISSITIGTMHIYPFNLCSILSALKLTSIETITYAKKK